MNWCALRVGPYAHKTRVQAIEAGLVGLVADIIELDEPDIARTALLVRHNKVRVGFTCGMRTREAGARGFLRARGIPLLVTDLGYFLRAGGPRDEKGYNQLGIDGLCWAPPEDCESSRFSSLGLSLHTPAQDRPRVALVLGQVPYDTQHHLDVETLVAWLTEQVGFYQGAGFRVIYRPHPAAPTVVPVVQNIEVHVPAEHTLAHDLSLVAEACTYNSTAGLEALIAGVPVRCAPCAHYAAVADYGRTVTPAQVQAYLNRLAWAQWTIDELRNGTALQFINRWAKFLPKSASEQPLAA